MNEYDLYYRIIWIKCGALGIMSSSPSVAALGTLTGGTLGYLIGARAKRHIDDRDELMRRDMRDAVRNKK